MAGPGVCIYTISCSYSSCMRQNFGMVRQLRVPFQCRSDDRTFVLAGMLFLLLIVYTFNTVVHMEQFFKNIILTKSMR